MARRTLQLADSANIVSPVGAGLKSVQDAIAMFMGLRQKGIDDTRQQQIVDQQGAYQTGQLAQGKAALDLQGKDFNAKLASDAQARKDRLDELKSTGDENLAKWIATNYGGTEASPQQADLFKRANLPLEAQQSLPATRQAPATTMPNIQPSGRTTPFGPGEGLDQPAAAQPFNAAPSSVPSAPTGRMMIPQTMDDRMRAAAMKASQDALALSNKQDQFNLTSTLRERDINNREQQSSIMNEIRRAGIEAAGTRSQAASERAQHAAEIADARLKLSQAQFDAKQTESKNSKATAAQGTHDELMSTLALIDKLEAHPGFSGIIGGARVPKVILNTVGGATQAAGAQALLDTLQARLTLDKVAEMKRQSRTGATGMGVLSDKDTALLGNSVGSINKQSQPEADFKASLAEIKRTHRIMAGLDPVTGQPVTPPAGPKVYLDDNGNPK